MLNRTQVQLSVTGYESKTVGAIQSRIPVDDIIVVFTKAFTDGTGLDQAQKLAAASFTIGAGATTNLDLQAIPGLGGNVSFTAVKFLIITNSGTNAGDIVDVGDDGIVANPWTSYMKGGTPRVTLDPSGLFVALAPSAAGLAVAAGNKMVPLKNNGAVSVVVGVYVLGEGT